ncbi:hypothetical protein [Undibacterium terreum]|uniref:Uncharacterized protein n=1 Tax=Undibacterium terreum TaxID=1224302 RepID=A0A916XQS0_9BURK|nr:hypothetical protein [Undibacterium terreum]GGC98771.1 hypothetical protein GCM10011396_52880 [Undibacterium terreum]
MAHINVAEYKGLTIALHTYEMADYRFRSSYKIVRTDGVVTYTDADVDSWPSEDEAREHAIDMAKEAIDALTGPTRH